MEVRPLFEVLRDDEEQNTSTVRFNYRYRGSDNSPSNLNILQGVTIDIPRIQDDEKRAKLFAVLGNLPATSNIEYTVYAYCQERAVNDEIVKHTIQESVKRLSQNIDIEFLKAESYEKNRTHTLEQTIKNAKKNSFELEKEMEERKNRWFGLGKNFDAVMDTVYNVMNKPNYSKKDVNTKAIHKFVNKQSRAEDELFFWKINSVSESLKRYRNQFALRKKGNEEFALAVQKNQELENSKLVTGVSLNLNDKNYKKLEQFFKSMFETDRGNHKRSFGNLESEEISQKLSKYVNEKGERTDTDYIAQNFNKEYVKNGLVLPENAMPISFVIDSPHSNDDMLVKIQAVGRIPGLYKLEKTTRSYPLDFEHSQEETYTAYRFLDGKKTAQALHCGYTITEYGKINDKGQAELEKSEHRLIPLKLKSKHNNVVKQAVLETSNAM